MAEEATLIFGKAVPRGNRRLSILRSRSWYDNEGYLNFKKVGVRATQVIQKVAQIDRGSLQPENLGLSLAIA